MNSASLDLTMDPQELIRCRTRFRPVIKEFRSQTKFSLEELEALLLIHYKLTKNQPMDRKYFRRIMYVMLDFHNDILIDRIFSAFDRNNKLVITMESWIIGMSIFLRGDLDERIKFCFSVYDMMGDGYIKKDHIFQALKTSIKVHPQDEDPEEVVKDMVDMIMKKIDMDRDGKISYKEYRACVWQNPSLLENPPSRPACNVFMSTFTERITTMHGKTLKQLSKKQRAKYV